MIWACVKAPRAPMVGDDSLVGVVEDAGLLVSIVVGG
jgi:hypothetical protein